MTVSPLAEYHARGFLIMIAEAYALHEPWLTTRFYEYGELFRDRLSLGAFISGSDYVQAIRRRRELCREMAMAMADLDVVISAAQPAEAPLITEVPKWGMFEKPNFTIPFNVTGSPAMSVCTGYGAGGLPVSMQIAGKPFDETAVFRVGHAYEQAMQWRERRPAMTLQTEGVALWKTPRTLPGLPCSALRRCGVTLEPERLPVLRVSYVRYLEFVRVLDEPLAYTDEPALSLYLLPTPVTS